MPFCTPPKITTSTNTAKITRNNTGRQGWVENWAKWSETGAALVPREARVPEMASQT